VVFLYCCKVMATWQGIIHSYRGRDFLGLVDASKGIKRVQTCPLLLTTQISQSQLIPPNDT